MSKHEDDLLETARKRFKLVSESEASQRIREIDDLRFQVPELQWTDDAKRQRQGGPVPGVSVELPARPLLSVPKLNQPIQLILNQERSSRLGVNVHPISESADRDTAEAIQGLYRKIERDSNAIQARSWAFQRAVLAGRGGYRVNLAYDDDSGQPFDLKITIDRVLHQQNMYFDPTAQAADWSDGDWAFNCAWMSPETFKRQFPKSKLDPGDRLEWANLEGEAPEWVGEDGLLVAEYWYREWTTERLLLLSTGDVVIASDGVKMPRGVKVIRERDREVPTVKYCKLNGLEVLEEKTWDGRYIPLVPVIGRELIPFDRERRWTGVIGPAKDAQRIFNHGVSTMVETSANEPRAPWLATPQQIEGYEAWWAQSNTRNFPYLPYNPTGGAQPPSRVAIDASRMGPSMMLVQQADDYIQSTTFTPDASLGKFPQNERSGRAIVALQGQSDAGNSDYMHNLAQVSMMYEARIVLDLIPIVYDRPGRITEILDFEDKPRAVMLNAPFTMNQDRPQMAAPNAQGAKLYDLRRGVYGVSVTIGKSYQSRLQAGAEEIGRILEAAPNLMPLIGPIYFKFRDFPGAPELAKMLEKVREKQFPGLDDDEQQSPEQLQAMLQRAGQENQALKQQLQGAMKQLETEAAKQQAQLAKAQLDAQTRTQAVQTEAKVKLMLEQVRAESKKALLEMEQRFERLQNDMQRAHEFALQRAENASEELQAAIRSDETEQGGE